MFLTLFDFLLEVADLLFYRHIVKRQLIFLLLQLLQRLLLQRLLLQRL